MSQCTTSSQAEASSAKSAEPAAKPIQIVPKKAVLNSHGCGGDCTDHDDSNAPWPRVKVLELLNLPFNDLMWQAQQVHRAHWDANEIEHATLLSVKTGGCPEDCGYCPQSASHDTGVEASKLMSPDEVREAVVAARDAGASRFCMGAAWRAPKDRDIEKVAELIGVIKDEGLEACCTLGMLTDTQAKSLKDAGLDYYNHNLDTAPELYGDIISTRDLQDRLDTLGHVRSANIKVCSGGIVGMGETREGRAGLIAQLANLPTYPESVPINDLVRVPGTPLADTPPLDPLEFVRTIAVARITMPTARVRLSAGRQAMSEAVQALCFLAGANSIFYGDKLLTTGNPAFDNDQALMKKLGLRSGKAVTARVNAA
ncbi:MAG: biotin synthase BioB [Aquabacterium sp.]|uniref:biotin synthase BioB n=1 Tax=Aquabacterium sp. TaxID=1872578 RepID=UPI0025C351E4|nr:biotin synthase BioB [Aquabacterium sp.]MBI3382292.1 biotin synthase BioB [Aquabacterium sp.]